MMKILIFLFLLISSASSMGQVNTYTIDSSNIYYNAIVNCLDTSKKTYILGTKNLYEIVDILPRNVVLIDDKELIRKFAKKKIEGYTNFGIDIAKNGQLSIKFIHNFIEVHGREVRLIYDCAITAFYEKNCTDNKFFFRSKQIDCL